MYATETKTLDKVNINLEYYRYVKHPDYGMVFMLMFSGISAETGVCFLSREKLANSLGKSTDSIKRARRYLVAHGFIQQVGSYHCIPAYTMTEKARKDLGINKPLKLHMISLFDEYKYLLFSKSPDTEPVNTSAADLACSSIPTVHEEAQTTPIAQSDVVGADDKVNTVPCSVEEPLQANTTFVERKKVEPIPPEINKENPLEMADYMDLWFGNAINNLMLFRYQGRRKEWTLEDIKEFYAAQPYKWIAPDFNATKAYYKNFADIKYNEREFKSKIVTILNMNSIKPEFAAIYNNLLSMANEEKQQIADAKETADYDADMEQKLQAMEALYASQVDCREA